MSNVARPTRAAVERSSGTSEAAAARDGPDGGPGGEPRTHVEVFADRRLLALIVAVPVLTAASLIAFRFFPGDPMLASGLGAVVVGFVVFLLFTLRVPEAFAIVRLRGLVPDEAVPHYEAFERSVGRALNSRWSAVLASIGAVIGFARFPIEAGGLGALLGTQPTGLRNWGLVDLGDVLGETLIGAAAGFAIWRMVVVGVKVFELGRFPLIVKLAHPDRCGGFEPIGDLCLWNALILAVPGVFLGWWIVVAPTIPGYGSTYVPLHTVLASVVVVVATVAFLAPLWGIHQAMVRSAEAIRDDIERHAQRIDELARELVTARDDMTPEEWEAKSKDLERRQALYLSNENVPTWPIDVRIVTKFAWSQLVPVLSVTGLSKPVVDAVKALTSIIDKAGS